VSKNREYTWVYKALATNGIIDSRLPIKLLIFPNSSVGMIFDIVDRGITNVPPDKIVNNGAMYIRTGVVAKVKTREDTKFPTQATIPFAGSERENNFVSTAIDAKLAKKPMTVL